MGRRRPWPAMATAVEFFLFLLLAVPLAAAPQRQLPWLLFPTPSYPYSFHSLLGPSPSPAAAAHLTLPTPSSRDRVIGAAGKWLAFAAPDNSTYFFLDPFSSSSTRADRIPAGVRGSTAPADIQLVKFSSAPVAGEKFIAAAVSGSHQLLLFWRPGMRQWSAVEGLLEPFHKKIEDFMYFDGLGRKMFHAVTDDEEVLAFPLDGGDTGDLKSMYLLSYYAVKRPGFDEEGNALRRRYLVDSQGKLLMVVRYLVVEKGSVMPRTKGFKVFEIEKLKKSCEMCGPPYYRWLERKNLEGEIMFISSGCSKSFNVSRYPGLKEGTIFFTDDDLEATEAQYPSFGIGRYSVKDGSIATVPVAELRSSLYPPIWYDFSAA